MNEICEICGATTHQLGQTNVLDKYSVNYYVCEQCGFVQTETPFWLDDAYASPITASDIGLAERSVRTAVITQALLRVFFSPGRSYLDYGGGYGLFVRLMRDAGYDFYRHDLYTPNLFAAGFDADATAVQKYELVTAFEVVEHLVQPYAEFERMFSLSRNIFFSTRLVSRPPQPLDQWWYYGLEHGQHVALYSHAALTRIAEDFGVNYFTDGRGLHLFTPLRLSASLFRLVTRYRVAQVMALLARQRSLQSDDYYKVTGRRQS